MENMLPMDIEKRSFELITQELSRLMEDETASARLSARSAGEMSVLKRVIHTTADFDYVTNLVFHQDAFYRGLSAIEKGACIVTDTQMTKSGINKKMLARYGGTVYCFVADEDVAAEAKAKGTTRSRISMDKAAALKKPLIFAIGNAPTALIRIDELVNEEALQPELIIGVPVGFVNVAEAKELILSSEIPAIIASGRKGGSNVAAAICNALLYELGGREE